MEIKNNSCKALPLETKYMVENHNWDPNDCIFLLDPLLIRNMKFNQIIVWFGALHLFENIGIFL